MNKIKIFLIEATNSVYCRFILLFGLIYLLILFPILNYILKKYTVIFSILNILICFILIGCVIVIMLEFVKYGKPIKIKDEILKSMKIIEDKTNKRVRFIPKDQNTNHFFKFFYNPNLLVEGLATVGLQTRNDIINNVPGSICSNNKCSKNYIELKDISYNTIIHEILHVLGFKHEFNRYDRDNLKIPLIFDTSDPNYKKRDYVLDYEKGVPYDIFSVMNYPYEDSNKYKNKYDSSSIKIFNTIKLYKFLFKPINTENVMTDIDIKKIKKIY
tara:strand:- start:123 stop:938 length:816 start_codon:yes stop_codon:yes gene_type:complete